MWFNTLDIDPNHLVELLYDRFLLCKVPFSSFLYSTLWKEVTMCSPHLRSAVVRSPFLRMEYLIINYFKILLHGRFVSSSSLIYSIIYLYVVWTKRYLFYTLGYGTPKYKINILVYLFLLLKLFQLWPLGAL